MRAGPATLRQLDLCSVVHPKLFIPIPTFSVPVMDQTIFRTVFQINFFLQNLAPF